MVYARYANTFDGGTAGQQITPANSSSSGTAFSAQFNAGVATYNAAAAKQGALGMLAPGDTSQVSFLHDFTACAAAGISFEFATPSLPGADMHLARITDTSNTRLISVHINSANKLRWSDMSGTTGVATAANALQANTNYRIELWAKAGTATNNGELRGAYFLQGSTSPIETFTVTTANCGTGTPFPRVNIGKITGQAIASTWDSFVWETDGTGLPGPYVAPATPLATPVVTLGTKTNPSTSGGTGAQVVTWPAVSGAVSYEAWLANNLTPAQGDFTRVAQGVTSPYTFTDLTPGDHAYGIKAKVS